MTTTTIYNAGSCLPLLGPSGWREQLEAVKLARFELLVPQCLHSYLAFSSPSYKACLPLFGPAGWREQEDAVRLARLEFFVPQYLQ